MKSTVEILSPTRVRLAIEVPFAELEPSLRKAYREISAQVNIPGFRRGKVPSAVIDQRVGRKAILAEAVQGAIPEQFVAAVREHDVRTLGRPDVEVGDIEDGQPLRFTAEVDVRPEITLPDLAGIEVIVDDVQVTDADVEEHLNGLRQRFATLKTVERPARRGDFVQIDLAATVDGEEVPGGTASNLSHEVGSNKLLPGLDDTLDGMNAGEAATFKSTLVAGDLGGREADVAVSVRTVKEREMPAANDEFAQLASEFDTLEELRADLATRLGRVKRLEQLYSARDKALEALVAASDVPAPEGVLKDEVSSRKQAMVDQLERMGVSLEEYLKVESKTEDEFDAELSKAALDSVKIQILLDVFADEQGLAVSDDEYMREIVHRANRAGLAPQQYYDQLVRAGMAATVYGDVRRGQALAAVLERVTIKDSSGAPVALDDLRDDDGDANDAGAADDHD